MREARMGGMVFWLVASFFKSWVVSVMRFYYIVGFYADGPLLVCSAKVIMVCDTSKELNFSFCWVRFCYFLVGFFGVCFFWLVLRSIDVLNFSLDDSV